MQTPPDLCGFWSPRAYTAFTPTKLSPHPLKFFQIKYLPMSSLLGKHIFNDSEYTSGFSLRHMALQRELKLVPYTYRMV